MCQYFVLLLDRGVSLMYSLSSQHCKLIISYYDHYLLILCSLVIVMKFLLSSCGIQIREDRTYLSTEQNIARKKTTFFCITHTMPNVSVATWATLRRVFLYAHN